MFIFEDMERKYVLLLHIFLLLLTQTSSQKLSTFGRAKPQAPTDETSDAQPKLKTFGSYGGGTSTPQSTNFYTRNRRRWWWFFNNWKFFRYYLKFCLIVSNFDSFTISRPKGRKF